jgi:hypothetical protein
LSRSQLSLRHHALRGAAPLLAVLLLSPTHLCGQAVSAASPSSVSASATAAEHDSGPAGIIPFTPGVNFSLVTASQHDSAGGWSSTLTPNLAYRFNSHFSLDLEAPVYAYVNVVTSHAVKVGGVTTHVVTGSATKHFVLGDTTLDGEFDAHPSIFDYTLTGTLGMPTGDNANGLGTGQFTYSFINHFEHAFGDYLTPDIELGIGDSPNLDNTRVRKSYVAVGTSAHFQAGLGVSLPWHMNFSSDAYEELPLSAQSITSTTLKGKKGKVLKTITTTEGVGEDNGFLNSLDIPLTGHITLSGFYNRSLRNKIDTAGFSLTFLLRAAPRDRDQIR